MRIRLPNNGWKPRPSQMPLWTYLENGGKHAELVAHRRFGKDEICLHRSAIAAFERVANYWHMLPEAAQARKAIWGAVNPHTGIRRIDEAFPAELRQTTRDQEMQIVFKNGSSWQVVGSDNFNSLVGSAPAGIVYSEWAIANPAAKAYLRPIIAENNGWQIFIGTPRGRNHAYRTYMEAKQDPKAFAQILRADETGIFTPEQLEKEKRELINEFGPDFGEGLFQQEYFCSFDAAIMGAVLGRWMTRAQSEGRIQANVFDPDGAPIEISSDIGFRDTAAWWFWQPRFDGLGLVHYEAGSGLDADDWVTIIERICGERGFKLGKIWLPHDARNKTFATKHSPMERFLNRFGVKIVDIVPKTKIIDRINAARRVVNRCYFDEYYCPAGIDSLCSWAYKYDEESKTFSSEPEHDMHSHPGDSFSYGAQMMEERLQEIAEADKSIRGITVGNNTVTLDELWATHKPAQERF